MRGKNIQRNIQRFLTFLCAAAIMTSPVPIHASGTASPMDTVIERSPLRQDAMTDVQKEEGWELIGGYAYPPESLEGDTGRPAAAKPGLSENSLAMVTFAADISSGQTVPFMIYYINTDTYQEYYLELYASEGYSASVQLPPGTYSFTAAGPTNDQMSLYQVLEPLTFQVKKTGTMVRPVIRSRGSTLVADTGESGDESAAVEIEKPLEKTAISDDYQWQRYLLAALISTGAGALIMLTALLVKKIGQNGNRHGRE